MDAGKERIFLEVGKVLEKKVYVGTSKLRLLECMELGDDYTKWLTTNELESHIHVVPLWSIASFKRMGSISRYYQVHLKTLHLSPSHITHQTMALL
jgi:DNA cross-link repair 1A protein